MPTVTPLRRPHLDARNLAAARLLRDRWESRVNALANCIEHLMSVHEMTEQNAELAAIQAYAEIEATNQQARIDVEASTSHVVVVRTEEKYPVVFTITDLMKMLDQARQEDRAIVFTRERHSPTVIEQ
uniref:hypothetical protein n=1 Tax=Halomonas sp. TaxID=1486246 RepID=UPI002617AC5E|nr:hypothetical protein [Halomonas sp.]